MKQFELKFLQNKAETSPRKNQEEPLHFFHKSWWFKQWACAIFSQKTRPLYRLGVSTDSPQCGQVFFVDPEVDGLEVDDWYCQEGEQVLHSGISVWGINCKVEHAKINSNFSPHLATNPIKKMWIFLLLLTRFTPTFVNFVIVTSVVKKICQCKIWIKI